MTEFDDVIRVWSRYTQSIKDWQLLTHNISPKESGCGILYELPNPMERPKESLAIADMRQLSISEPHKHLHDETEIYFILQGTGKIAVGDQLFNVTENDVVVIPPETIHIVLPTNDLVIAAVTTPPFNQANYVRLPENNASVKAMKYSLLNGKIK